MMKLPKYLKRAHAESTKQGWTWVYKGSHHVTIRDEKGDFVIAMSLTSYDGTLTRKITGKLKKAGCPGL